MKAKEMRLGCLMQAAELGVLTDPGLGDAGCIAGELWDGLVFIGDVIPNQLVAVERGGRSWRRACGRRRSRERS
jgi:hypothetical protein